ncbi:MAG: hypothetical protein M9934_13540 [Thermomicrobiales bacterium]|nr:hypothetical protein [Thermomicrobiales bacterium]MCO5229286.1 hypothetical protein [Thermomicrobiales bacterium]
MTTLTAHLELSDSTSERTRERCPWVVFHQDDRELVRLRTDTEQPTLPFPDGNMESITLCDDILSRVIDEEAWLAELSRVLAAGGELRFTVPKTGPFAWLDAMDAHRYAVDIGKRGDPPDAALPTGWNRHYTGAELRALCAESGLRAVSLTTINYATHEARMIAGLLWKNWVRGDRDAERELWPQFGRRNSGDRPSLIGTTWSVRARKPIHP